MPTRVASPSITAVMLAAGTVTCWAALVVTAVRAAERRSWRWLLPAVLPYAALAILRPGDLGELIGPWESALADGSPAALLSTVLVFGGIGWLVHVAWHQADREMLKRR